jgi:adenine-specific DNA-methyltransferase
VGKRLELIWPEKEKILLGLDDNGKPIWGTKADLETRLLVQLEAVGETNPDNLNDLYEQGDNLLIKGDNLLALKALERHFSGKIKCIYIDPPFNTGNAFEYYDDGLEHTIWLSMMKARLEILGKLLREDGAIFLEIDDTEQAYLKVLMDEVFGRSNYVLSIAVKRSAATGHKAINPSPVNVCEFIHIYARDKSKWRYIQQLVSRKGYDWAYNYVVTNKNDSFPGWKFAPLSNVVAKELGFGDAREARKVMGKNNLENAMVDFALKHSDITIRFAQPNYGGVSQAARDLIDESKVKTDEVLCLRRKAYSDMYFYRGNRILFLHDKVQRGEEGNQIVEPLTNFWDDIPWQGIAREGGIDFPKNKKPEKLIRRILEISTERADWILDSFLGSGTTAAVAHKLGRKWVGVEIGEHAETLCLPRLKRVVSGEDQTGISKEVGWKGGDGFRYCVLGESLFAKDTDTGLVMINPKYTNGPLVAAVCNLESFYLNNDSLFHGVRGNTYAHITEDKITQAYLDALVENLPGGKNLVVYCLKRATGLEMSQEIKVKRIPKELQIPRYLTSAWEGGGE